MARAQGRVEASHGLVPWAARVTHFRCANTLANDAMKPHLPRLFTGVLTFIVGYAGHSLTRPLPQSAEIVSPPANSQPQPFTVGFRIGEPTKEKPTRRVSQEAVIKMPKIGKVRIQAFEPLGDGPEFVFSDADSGKEILAEYFYDNGLNERSQTRFKIISVKQFAGPLIISIGMNPGGSDCGWEASIAGVVNGRLEQLTYEHLQTSNDGGFFIGDLGHGVGFGVAQWNFVWGEGEGHPPPHKYEITLYKWNGWRFEWHRMFRTRSRYNSARAALRAYGLKYVDIRKSFPEWSDLESW